MVGGASALGSLPLATGLRPSKGKASGYLSSAEGAMLSVTFRTAAVKARRTGGVNPVTAVVLGRGGEEAEGHLSRSGRSCCSPLRALSSGLDPGVPSTRSYGGLLRPA